MLKTSTADAHGRLERRAVATGFLRERGAYRRYLFAMSIFYEPCEAALRGGADVDPEIAARTKLPWLRADLDALGGTADLSSSMPSFGGPEIRGASLWGLAYVLEGATLGGRFILRELDGSGVVPSNARRFFTGYGPRTGEMWRTFRSHLERAIERGTSLDDVVRGAVDTFDAMHAWIDRALPARLDPSRGALDDG
ncbi:MAG: biliverdin-producing heme oxygenase [Polyangiaceae bacterium]